MKPRIWADRCWSLQGGSLTEDRGQGEERQEGNREESEEIRR